MSLMKNSSTNIINAIINIVNNPIIELKQYAKSHNRANNMGEALEEYVKDIFAGTVGEKDLAIRNRRIQECFSYLGNQNNPPDSIIKHGDAIEVKKIESFNSSLALNSSYPKSKLYRNSRMLTDACRNCELWLEKDLIYVVGVCKNNVLSSLSFVYGEDYAASSSIYERIKSTIKNGIDLIPNVEFAETNELGRVNRVDPLGITYLRVRGMWGIENPFKAFSYVYQKDDKKSFNMMAIINEQKYKSFKEIEQLEALSFKHKELMINNIEIKSPDNPALLRKAKLITYKR